MSYQVAVQHTNLIISIFSALTNQQYFTSRIFKCACVFVKLYNIFVVTKLTYANQIVTHIFNQNYFLYDNFTVENLTINHNLPLESSPKVILGPQQLMTSYNILMIFFFGQHLDVANHISRASTVPISSELPQLLNLSYLK